LQQHAEDIEDPPSHAVDLALLAGPIATDDGSTKNRAYGIAMP
jgi:hypothetical protein